MYGILGLSGKALQITVLQRYRLLGTNDLSFLVESLGYLEGSSKNDLI